jgi:hypothetical protein
MPTKDQLRSWVLTGKYKLYTPILLQRPSAITYPNTFVMMWKSVVIGGHTVSHVCLDLHYTGSSIKSGEPLQALGGMWAKGVYGALHPEQSLAMRDKLRAVAPLNSPDPDGMETFGSY